MTDELRELDDGELAVSLDSYRQVVERKITGLSLEQATAVVTPTGVTLLGIVRHLTWVERRWFEQQLLGAPRPYVDIEASFRVDDVDSVDDVVADYRAACDRSREITTQAESLDLTATEPHWAFGLVTLRWILFHMVRETARHAGHMDILRELTDGQTGDF